jgi:ATP-dependent helicase/nuclease subunit A
MTDLRIVPAGAGAGKTFEIKKTLATWIKSGAVRPERVLAVTFTEAAAGELRERIRTALLKEGLPIAALAVERAYVSTIHSLGLRLLTEHAFSGGTSPQPRHLDEAERNMLIREALPHASALKPIETELERYGYVYDGGSGKSGEEKLREAVLKQIDLLRGLGDVGADAGLIEPALARMAEVYGPVLEDVEAAKALLLGAIREMLRSHPEGGGENISAKGNLDKLSNDLELLRQVDTLPELLDYNWKLWNNLRKLFTGNSRSKTPEGYDDCVLAIIDAAEAIVRHPGPLADAQFHFQCLTKCAQEVLEAYEARKRSFGLIDYADMVAGAECLLRTRPDALETALGEIDCVVIDEFQDTNPVQFALLWRLAQRAPRCLLVGDVKQSIMGFQGADPRLSNALAEANPQNTQALHRNWRSTPALMEFVNAMGAGLFGNHYQPLEPQRDPVSVVALEALRISKGRLVRNYSKPHEHIAERIARLLSDGEEVTDRRTGAKRAARPSDIALLVGRHKAAANYAEELRLRGVPVRIAEGGWYASQVVSVARAALAYAANPTDTHAGILLLVLGPEQEPLQTALHRKMEGNFHDDPTLRVLATLSDGLLDLPTATVCARVFALAGLDAWADCWLDSGQSRADLLKLEAAAEEFDAAHVDLKAAAGFHGETLKVFLAWLAHRSEDDSFDKRPDPGAETTEAVEIVTWHGSKGREWPITVVAEFDKSIAEWPNTTTTTFTRLDDLSDMDAVLDSAALIHTPSLDTPEAQMRVIEDRREAFEETAKNLLYVAMTRARDRLIIEWPDWLKARDDGAAADCLFHVLEDRTGIATDSGAITLNGVSCAATVHYVPEQVSCTNLEANIAEVRPRFGALQPMEATAQTPWRYRPSQGRGRALGQGRDYTLGPAWPAEAGSAARGNALHMAVRALLLRPDIAGRIRDASGLDETVLARVAARANELRNWLNINGYTELHAEIPVEGHTSQGAMISGVIDLLAISPKGALVIDHKSGGAGEGFGPYEAQLASYADLVPSLTGHAVTGVAINWIDHGRFIIHDLAPISDEQSA